MAFLAASLLPFVAGCADTRPERTPKPTPRPSGDWCEYEGCDQEAVIDFAGETGPVRYCQEHFEMELKRFHEENQRARPTASVEPHPCDEPGCANMAALSIAKGNGEPAYYCLVHYEKLLEVLGAAEEDLADPAPVAPEEAATQTAAAQ